MDIYTEITNRIINQLEQGVIPWRKPWVACGAAISYSTGKPYSLLNQMLLGKAGKLPGELAPELVEKAEREGRKFFNGNPQDN